MTKGFIRLFIFIIITTLLFACTKKKEDESGLPGPNKGNPAPSFTLKDINDNDVSLSSYKGKVIIVNFWATWCKPCQEEMDDLESAYKKNNDKGLVILGVDVREEKKDVLNFLKKYKVSYPILMDFDGKVVKDYQVMGVPTSYFIDRDGIIRERIFGGMNELVIEATLDDLFRVKK
ncbi:MAG: TlpA disulfide reductase family protein [Nitrospirota bacterium]